MIRALSLRFVIIRALSSFFGLNFRELQVEAYSEFRCQMEVPTGEEEGEEEALLAARETTKCTTT